MDNIIEMNKITLKDGVRFSSVDRALAPRAKATSPCFSDVGSDPALVICCLSSSLSLP